MPTKHRADHLSPALRHFLMAGCTASRFAPARLPGWFATHMEIVPNATALTAQWLEHRAALTAEARAHGFEPVAASWFDGDRLKADSSDVATDVNAARMRWSEKFCREFGY